MPIYEFACPHCRVIYNFLSKRVNPDHSPVCPKCGNKNLAKQMSRFAALSGSAKSTRDDVSETGDGPEAPDFEDARMLRAMSELERDMEHMDENNPRHMAHMIKKMKDLMPPGTMPAELDVAIKRLEAGEDPEKIEEDMGPILEQAFGGEGEEEAGGGFVAGGYTRDSGLYDY